MTQLIDDLAKVDQLVLALDDYHAIANSQIHQAIALFLENLPTTIHLVLISRETPPLSLSRLRGQGQVTSLGVVDLRFTIEETANFLSDRLGMTIDRQAIAN